MAYVEPFIAQFATYEKFENACCSFDVSMALTGVKIGISLVNSSSKLEVSALPLTVGKNGGGIFLANISSQLMPAKNG